MNKLIERVESKLKKMVDFRIDNNIYKIQNKMYQILSTENVREEEYGEIWSRWKSRFLNDF